MNITIDITQSQYRGTGVGEYTYNLVTHLLQLDSAHSISLFGGSLRGFSQLKSISGRFSTPSHIYPIPPTAFDWLFNRLHWPNIETLVGPTDVFHASDWAQPPTKHAKIVSTVHDITPILFPQHHHPKVVSAFQKRMQWVAKEASAIITDSDATQKDLIQHFHLDPAKITTIYLAASSDFTQFASLKHSKKVKATQKTVRKYSLKPPYFLSVGTDEPRKNLDRTIQAFSQFFSTSPDPYSLVIAGKYGWGESLKNIPDNIKERIHLLGFVPQSDLPGLYVGASSFVYPSLYEGFGLPILEAMTLGIPVVTTKRGSLGEIAGRATVLVDPESVSSIQTGLQLSLAKARKLSKLGLAQASKFSWSKTAAQTLNVYEQLASK